MLFLVEEKVYVSLLWMTKTNSDIQGMRTGVGVAYIVDRDGGKKGFEVFLCPVRLSSLGKLVKF